MAYYHPFMPFAHCAPAARRSAPTFSNFTNDIAPLFSVVNSIFGDLDRHINKPAVRTYQPRFDVREEKDAFHLHGELPGVEQKDLQIEFGAENTLVVKGRTVREAHKDNTPAVEASGESKAVEAAEPTSTATTTTEPAAEAADSSSTTSATNYHKTTVEPDENDDGWTDAAPASATVRADATPATETQHQTPPQESQAPTKQSPPEESSRYWVSERSIGEFQRSFKFPGRIDQEAVTAKLSNGVLHVVIPKAVQKAPRWINVE